MVITAQMRTSAVSAAAAASPAESAGVVAAMKSLSDAVSGISCPQSVSQLRSVQTQLQHSSAGDCLNTAESVSGSSQVNRSRLMRKVVSALLCLIAGVLSVRTAAAVQFPYEARVIAEETWVRSGNDERFYPTQRLAQGSIVTVHRHDPGGWYMIDPPQGSFSWIAERYVNRLDASRGVVREDNVIACIGSDFGDEISAFQRKLNAGDEVTILGRRDMETSSGRQSMLKILPPRRERRWIPGVAVVPVDAGQRQLADSDAYRIPSNAVQPGLVVTPDATVSNEEDPKLLVSQQLQEQQQQTTERNQVALLDRRFREMVLQDAAGWDLDAMEKEYRQLQEELTSPALSKAIELRFSAIRRYRQRLAELAQIRNLQSGTERRDSSLVSRHGFRSMMSATISPLSQPVPNRSMAVAQLQPQSFFSSLPELSAPAPQPEMSVSQGNAESFVFSEAQETLPPEALVGATSARSGVVQASATAESFPRSSESAVGTASGVSAESSVLQPGSPWNPFVGAGILLPAEGANGGFVLSDARGNVLAELRAANAAELSEYTGQQVGVMGTRWSQEDRRDIIDVSGVRRVRLAE